MNSKIGICQEISAFHRTLHKSQNGPGIYIILNTMVGEGGQVQVGLGYVLGLAPSMGGGGRDKKNEDLRV